MNLVKKRKTLLKKEKGSILHRFQKFCSRKLKSGERIPSTVVPLHTEWTEDFIISITGQENTTTKPKTDSFSEPVFVGKNVPVHILFFAKIE